MNVIIRSIISACLLMTVGPAFAEDSNDEPFEYFSNSWNVIGLKDYGAGTRITPANTLMTKRSQTRTVTIRTGTELIPLSGELVKTCENGWLPIILLTTWDDKIRYEIKMWATPAPGVKNWKKAFDGPSEGENYQNWIKVTAANTGDQPGEAKFQLEGLGKVLGNKTLSWNLKPGAVEEGSVNYPFFIDCPDVYADKDADLWLQRTIDYWNESLAPFCHIHTPCKKANEAYLAAHVCQLIARDGGVLKGGEGFYDKFFLRDAAYQVMELEEAGMLDESRVMVEKYLDHQMEDGRFTSPGGIEQYEWDANGQSQWVLWQYFKMTGDKEWLARVYPRMRKASDWAIKARKWDTGNRYARISGMLPATLADGECLVSWKFHVVGYDFWNLRGMRCTADAARIIGKSEDAKYLTEEADAYRKAIDKAWSYQKSPHFLPTWEGAGTHWGNTETLWPTMIFDKGDSRVQALVDHVRNDYNGGFIEGTIQWVRIPGYKSTRPEAIHPYMGAYTTMVDLTLGNHENVVQDFFWYLLHSSASHAFPEGVLYEKRAAWRDLIPHVTGACNYAIMLRHMLIHEEGNVLHLLKAVPDWWLEEGREIRIERAPTHFGMMNLVVRGKNDGVEVEVDLPTRESPSEIVIHLPGSRPLLTPLEGVRTASRTKQEKRWDMPTVIDIYRKDWWNQGKWIGEKNLKQDSRRTQALTPAMLTPKQQEKR